MALPLRRPLHARPLCFRIDDISTADNVSICPGIDCELVAWTVTLSATITGTAAITVEIDGVADATAADNLVALALKTPQTKTIAEGVSVRADQNLEFITDGGSSTASEAWFVAWIRDN